MGAVPLCHLAIKKSIVLCVTVLHVIQCVVLKLCDLRDLGPTGLL